MNESSVTLAAHDEEFEGRLTTPDGDTDSGVLVVPGGGHGPFGDVFDRFAETAAGRGHAVARFETWHSQDDLGEKTDAEFAAELDAGVDFLRDEGCSTVSVLAKSFGGRLVLEHPPEGVDRMVLWAPAVFVGDHEDEDRPTVSADELASVEIPVRIVQGDADEVVSVESARAIAEALSGGELLELPGEDHSFQNNESRVVGATVSFLAV